VLISGWAAGFAAGRFDGAEVLPFFPLPGRAQNCRKSHATVIRIRLHKKASLSPPFPSAIDQAELLRASPAPGAKASIASHHALDQETASKFSFFSRRRASFGAASETRSLSFAQRDFSLLLFPFSIKIRVRLRAPDRDVRVRLTVGASPRLVPPFLSIIGLRKDAASFGRVERLRELSFRGVKRSRPLFFFFPFRFFSGRPWHLFFLGAFIKAATLRVL